MNETKTLKLKSPMMHGPAVVRLQEMLSILDPDFEESDGIFGPMTRNAVHFFQKTHGLTMDGICGPKTWAAIIEACNSSTEKPTGEIIFDRRGLHPRPRLYKCKRPWSAITGVTLHQTGCEMPSNPAGWDRLNAHIGITQEGVAILVNDPTDFIWHAQGLSASTIGVEIEGNYCGIDGDEKTLWNGGGGPHHLNPKMLDALDSVRVWISDQFKENGQEWERIYSHRQSAKSRIGDPGEEIWRRVAIRWAWKSEAPTESGFHVGTGRPLPHEWFDMYQGEYYCKPGG